MDRLSPEKRSWLMSRVRGVNTKPEKVVRSLVHRLGFRYRIHVRDLPGKPDLAFRSKRKAIFVHGCFWHGHRCTKGRLPKSRLDYWEPKIEENRRRDRRKVSALKDMEWDILELWECQLKNPDKIKSRIRRFLLNKA